MRRFVDLHLKPPNDSVSAEMLSLAKQMRYARVSSILNSKISSLHGLDVVSRVDIEIKNRKDASSALSRARKSFTIVGVKCLTKESTRYAANDGRVDLLSFPSDLTQRREANFDRQTAGLASRSGCAYELNISDVISSGWQRTTKLLTRLMREIEVAQRFDVPIVVSSGASSVMQMREPRAISALLSLVGIGEEDAVEMVSSVPSGLIDRNLMKLSPEHVARGVRRVIGAS